MKSNFLKKATTLAMALFLSQIALVAHAQPDLNEAPKGDNPPARDRNKGGGKNMKLADEAIRNMLVQGGVKDVAAQDAVLAYMKEDAQARRPMREQGEKLFQAMRAEGITDEQMLALVTDYRAAQQAEKERREKAQAALDEKIHFSDNPRLEAILLLSGLIGDGGAMMNGRGGQFGKGANMQGVNAQRREENQKKMLERFDKNADGQLDQEEKTAMKLFRQERKGEREKRNDQPAGAPQAMPVPPENDVNDVMADDLDA